MVVCNMSMWINGVILTSIGSGLLFTAIVLKSSLRYVQEEMKFTEQVDIGIKLKSSELPEEVERLPIVRVHRKRIDF